MEKTISTILTLPPVERELQFHEVCVSNNRTELLSQIDVALKSSEHATLLSRWRCRVLLQDTTNLSEEDWKWLLQDHLLLCILTGIELSETIIEHLYFYSKTNTDVVAEEDMVTNRYTLFRSFITNNSTIVTLDSSDTPTVGELVLRIKKGKNDTLQFSELLLKIKNVLHQTSKASEILEADESAVVDNGVSELIDIIDFLTGPNVESIYPTVLRSMEPELFNSESEESKEVLQRKYNDDRTIYHRIHDHVLTYFGLPWKLDNDAIAKLFEYLSTAAIETKDPKVKELIYFDEQENGFVFNGELLDS